MKTLMYLFVGLAVATTAYAGKGSGGGGGFKVGNKYVTWDRAGIDLKNDGRQFDLDMETLRGLREFTNGLPAGDLIFSLGVGRNDYFKQGDKIGRSLRNRIRDEYSVCFERDEFNKQKRDFTIFAVSRKHETILLPEFFELDPIGRAKVLVHEAHVRTFGFSCKTLKLDQELSKAFDAYQGNAELSEVKISWIFRKVYRLGVFSGLSTLRLSMKSADGLKADFINRGIAVPSNLFSSENVLNSYLYPQNDETSMRNSIGQILSRGLILANQDLPEYLYTELINYKNSSIGAFGAEEKEAWTDTNTNEALAACEGLSPQSPVVFAINKDQKDFWNMDAKVLMGVCQAQENGQLQAVPKVELNGFLMNGDLW